MISQSPMQSISFDHDQIDLRGYFIVQNLYLIVLTIKNSILLIH
jgi:hypothetical protein